MTDVVPGQPENPKAAKAAAKAYAKADRPFYKKKRIIIPAAFVAIAGFSALGGGGGDTLDDTTTANASAEDAAATADATADTVAEPATPAAPAAPAPEYAGALDDDKVAGAPGAEIALSGWTVTASALGASSTPLGDVLCSDVSMTNRDDEQQEYNGLSWKLQTPNGNVQDITFIGDTDLTSGGLAPGGNVAKKVCFNDEAAGPGQYVLSWQPDIFSSEARGVWLNTL